MTSWTLKDADRAKAAAERLDPIVPGTVIIKDRDGTVKRYRYSEDWWEVVDRAAVKYGGGK